MKILMNFIEAGFAIVALLLACLFCTYAWPEAKYGLAAWVQAIGSIGAIIGAITIASRQNQHARKVASDDRRHDEHNRLVSVLAIAVQASEVCFGVKARWDSGIRHFDSNGDVDMLAGCHASLQSIPLLEVPGGQVTLWLAVVPSAVKRLEALLRTSATEASGFTLGMDTVDHLIPAHLKDTMATLQKVVDVTQAEILKREAIDH
jgi:hypothetical protein